MLSVTPDTPEVAEWRSKSPLDCVATTSTYLDDDDDGGSAVRGLRSVVRRARALGSARLAPEACRRPTRQRSTSHHRAANTPNELYGKFTWKIENFSETGKRELRSNQFDVGDYKW